MKPLSVIVLSSALVLCGCEKPPEQWENRTLAWPRNPITDEYFPKAYLTVYVGGESIETNFISMEAAADFLGQYGWELVSTGNNGKVYYLKRQKRPDGDFLISDSSLKDEEKTK